MILDNEEFTTPCPSCETDDVEICELRERERKAKLFDAYNHTTIVEGTLICTSCERMWNTRTPCEVSYDETKLVCEDTES
ncbi:MAG: hypothetical protein J07HQX50_01689 [Haloquadratum sp. J07HQX50]|nr:MAG: hypothetical protein J07HQX50_01689 [Haloquadratum sp. J07HQX50]